MLATRDLTFAYPHRRELILDGLTTSFANGSVTAVTGASGAGKSTLLYVLALMLRATRGQVLWHGRPVSDLPDAERARMRAAEFGFVFQDAMLDPSRTILDNVCEAALFAGIPHRVARTRAQELLAEFGIEHRADHRPGQISGGQAQRVALCRALVTSPTVVFGDEPTGNLDVTSARVVWTALREHAHQGATVIVATHDERLTGDADAVVRLP